MKAQPSGTEPQRLLRERRAVEERESLATGHTLLVSKHKSPGHSFVYNLKTRNYHPGCLTPMEMMKPLRPETIWRQKSSLSETRLFVQFFSE